MVMITRLPSIQPQWASMERIWIENGCLKSSSMQVYRRWIQRFFDYCHTRTLDVTSQLTHAGAAAFAQWYAKQYGIHDDTACSSTCSALHAWALACTVLGERVPDWSPTTTPSAPADPLLVAFAEYLDEQCGNRLVTQRKKVAHCAKLLAFPGAHNNDIAQLRLQDLDAFVMECGQHYGRTTLADLCSSLRSFLRFLHATGRLESDLAPSVMSPIVRRGRRPLRALPWRQVCQLLAAIDRSTPAGQRDYALLLTMSTYGLGAGEAIRLRLDDIEWHAMTIRITRPKTGVTIMLPLLSGVAEVLAEYLCKGRPKHAPTRHLFLSLHVPHRALGSSGPVRHIIMTHAKAAGTTAAYLGAHVLRHSCAVALLQAGTDITVIRDYLGHASIATTSHYAAANLAMKREVLEAFWDRAGLAPPRGTPWSPTPDLLAFLDSL